MNALRLAALVATPVALVVLTGCPNPNTYGTPRTVPAGKVQMVASLEGVGVSTSSQSSTVNGATTTVAGESFYAPTAPSVGVRIGLTDSLDLGLRLSELSSLQADAKFNFLKSNVFDMAVAPGLQGAYVSAGGTSLGLVYINLPLILGINFSHAATLVLTPGFTYAVATASVADGSGTGAFANGSAPLIRMGVGFNIRIGNQFALQPEVTALKGFNDLGALYWNFGLGFLIGTSKNAMPNYDDVN
jgi:hypothetical protein